jgi:hypothetical protein
VVSHNYAAAFVISVGVTPLVIAPVMMARANVDAARADIKLNRLRDRGSCQTGDRTSKNDECKSSPLHSYSPLANPLVETPAHRRRFQGFIDREQSSCDTR